MERLDRTHDLTYRVSGALAGTWPVTTTVHFTDSLGLAGESVYTSTLVVDSVCPTPTLEPAMAAATAAKSDGIGVFTIGLGSDVDTAQLLAMASSATTYYLAADAEDLAAIYAAIAAALPCPRERFWGRR